MPLGDRVMWKFPVPQARRNDVTKDSFKARTRPPQTPERSSATRYATGGRFGASDGVRGTVATSELGFGQRTNK